MKAALAAWIRQASALAAAVSLCGCFIGWQGGPKGRDDLEQPGASMSIEGKVWALESPRFGLTGTMPTANPITIEFIREPSADSGQLRGFSGCNTYFGTFEVVGAQLHLGPLGVTKMACPGAQLTMEAEFLSALAEATEYRFAATQLEIVRKGELPVLRFTRKVGAGVE